MPGSHVLIVEDEPDIGDLIRFHLEREGLDSHVIASGRTALEEIRQHPPDLLILDLMLPDLDGLEVCRRLKWDEHTREVPIVIVSAKGEEADIVTGLELGADDYVTKPFSPRVLMARIRNVMRRFSDRSAAAGATEAGTDKRNRISLADQGVIIDIDRHTIKVRGKPVEFTHTEFGILHYLAARPGFVRTRDQILSAVHGENVVLTSRTVDVHVTAIRRKLGDLGGLITTVRGVGYRLEELAENDEA